MLKIAFFDKNATYVENGRKGDTYRYKHGFIASVLNNYVHICARFVHVAFRQRFVSSTFCFVHVLFRSRFVHVWFRPRFIAPKRSLTFNIRFVSFTVRFVYIRSLLCEYPLGFLFDSDFIFDHCLVLLVTAMQV